MQVQKKVFNPGYTGCLVLYRVRTFSLELEIVRGVSGGENIRKVSGGWGRGCSRGNFVPRWDCTLCVYVRGGGSPHKVYGVIYGLDIVALEFTRPMCSFFFLLTLTPEERDETEPSVCCVFRKQRLCCHGQHDDCGGVRRDHLVSDVTVPEIYCLWYHLVSDETDPFTPPPPPPPHIHTLTHSYGFHRQILGVALPCIKS